MAAKININTATVEQLCTIPGIGTQKANAIVQHRLRYGIIAKESLSLLLMGAISHNTWDKFDFSIPTQVTTGPRMSLRSSFTAMEADLQAEIKETERSINKMLSLSEPKPSK